MGDVVNLNKFRKDRSREAERRAARNNRARFGRAGADKTAERLAKEKADQALDGKRLEKDGKDEEASGLPPEGPTPRAK